MRPRKDTIYWANTADRDLQNNAKVTHGQIRRSDLPTAMTQAIKYAPVLSLYGYLDSSLVKDLANRSEPARIIHFIGVQNYTVYLDEFFDRPLRALRKVHFYHGVVDSHGNPTRIHKEVDYLYLKASHCTESAFTTIYKSFPNLRYLYFNQSPVIRQHKSSSTKSSFLQLTWARLQPSNWPFVHAKSQGPCVFDLENFLTHCPNLVSIELGDVLLKPLSTTIDNSLFGHVKVLTFARLTCTLVQLADLIPRFQKLTRLFIEELKIIKEEEEEEEEDPFECDFSSLEDLEHLRFESITNDADERYRFFTFREGSDMEEGADSTEYRRIIIKVFSTRHIYHTSSGRLPAFYWERAIDHLQRITDWIHEINSK